VAKSDKTEKATPKKQRDARQKGQLAKSQDVVSWSALLIGLYLVPLTLRRLMEATTETFETLERVGGEPSGDVAVDTLGNALQSGFFAVFPLMATIAFGAVLASIGQTGPLLTLKPLKPNFKKLNPLQGFQRLFSMRSAWETVKQVAKMTIIVALVWPRLNRVVEAMVGNGRLPLWAGIDVASSHVMSMFRTVAWTMLIIALADFGYQKFQHARDLRMTKQEVKDEYKNTEGDGMVKGRIRSLQRAMARNRMMSEVADADVIVTNPTHIAVALRYDPLTAAAPRVLAVGAGALAMKIRELGTDSKVPIVEAKPLARALWRSCEAGDQIPVVLYEAGAKVLAFVRRLDQRFSPTGPIELPKAARVPDEVLEAVERKRRRRRR
jgi:flagellar biosynthetic protein FlhB